MSGRRGVVDVHGLLHWGSGELVAFLHEVVRTGKAAQELMFRLFFLHVSTLAWENLAATTGMCTVDTASLGVASIGLK